MTRQNPNPKPTSLVVLASAMDLPGGDAAPEWIHVLPSGTDIRAFDGRGPYQVQSPEAVIAASMSLDRLGGELVIDENHATDLAASKGGQAPARGWIKELQARADGIWARVEWTAAGAALVAERAYRGISPVFTHDGKGRVLRVLRASLTNQPNLSGLAALNQETPMTLMEKLAERLGLKADATEDDILAALPASNQTALQSAMTAIGTALGVSGDDPAAVLDAAKAAGKPAEITALQAQLTEVTTQLNGLRDSARRDKAAAFVDKAIGENRVGVKPSRDRFIALHMENAEETEKMILGMPVLGPSGIEGKPPAEGGEVFTALNAEQRNVADQLGIPHDKFLASLQADAKKEAR